MEDHHNERFGTTIEYPDRFHPGTPPTNGDGLSFKSADGVEFSVFGSLNALEHDLAGLKAFIEENLEPDQKVTYRAEGPNWFVISGAQGQKVFYERHLISHRSAIENGFVMSYPTRLQRAYDPIVTRMSKSFRPGRGYQTEGKP